MCIKLIGISQPTLLDFMPFIRISQKSQVFQLLRLRLARLHTYLYLSSYLEIGQRKQLLNYV
jgi:hypothetical protein